MPAPIRPGLRAEPPVHAPNAALLIDFDNVTLGIRSDLTKELRTLLSSEVIKGKVAVQRAYADWRRYPQYIVPLSESSIDLIFAPAFGTAKKNATSMPLHSDQLSAPTEKNTGGINSHNQGGNPVHNWRSDSSVNHVLTAATTPAHNIKCGPSYPIR